MEKKNIISDFSFFRDIVIPFGTIGVMFYFAFWGCKPPEWGYLMYRQLFSAVFFNYFLTKIIYWGVKSQEFNVSRLYVLLWEIIAPLVVIVFVFFSLLLESKFYDWNVLIRSRNESSLYVALVMFFLFLFFLRKGILFLVKMKK